MLERYYVRPDSVDRIRASWIGAPIEKYVGWLTEHGNTSRTVLRRTPLLMEFGEFARKHGATKLENFRTKLKASLCIGLKNTAKGAKPIKLVRN